MPTDTTYMRKQIRRNKAWANKYYIVNESHSSVRDCDLAVCSALSVDFRRHTIIRIADRLPSNLGRACLGGDRNAGEDGGPGGVVRARGHAIRLECLRRPNKFGGVIRSKLSLAKVVEEGDVVVVATLVALEVHDALERLSGADLVELLNTDGCKRRYFEASLQSAVAP